MKDEFPLWGYGVVLVLVLLVGYGFWVAGKHISYSMMYEGMVQQTIKEMVRPEVLR